MEAVIHRSLKVRAAFWLLFAGNFVLIFGLFSVLGWLHFSSGGDTLSFLLDEGLSIAFLLYVLALVNVKALKAVNRPRSASFAFGASMFFLGCTVTLIVVEHLMG